MPIVIDQLSISEKLALMEQLWNDLSCHPAELTSSEWHGDVLAERMRSVRDGTTTFVE